MIVGEMNCRRIFYSGLHDETRELPTHRKYEFNVHSELDIKAAEIHAEEMEKSHDENTGGTQAYSGEDTYISQQEIGPNM